MCSYVLYVLSFYHRISNTFALFLQSFFNVLLLHILTVTVHTCMIYLEKAVFVLPAHRVTLKKEYPTKKVASSGVHTNVG